MKFFVHVRDRIIEIEAGPGRQKIQWLGDCALHRIDSNYLMNVGTFRGIRLADGSAIDTQATISETLKDCDQITLLMKDDMPTEEGKNRTKGSMGSSRMSSNRSGPSNRNRSRA